MNYDATQTIQCGGTTCIIQEHYSKEGEALQKVLEQIAIKMIHKEVLG